MPSPSHHRRDSSRCAARPRVLTRGAHAGLFGCAAFVLLAALAGPARAQDSLARSLAGLPIGRVELKTAAGVDRTPLLTALDLKPGTRVSKTVVRAAIARLFEKANVADVVVRGRREGELAVLVFEIAPRVRLAELDFRGNGAVSSDDLRKEFNFQPDQEYSADVLERLEVSLADSFARRGYHKATFDMEVREDKSGERVRIFTDVRQGVATRIRGIELVGQLRFSRETILAVMRLRDGQVLDRARLRASAEALTSFYRKKGYYEVKVGQPYLKLDPANPLGAVRFQIDVGPHVTVRFVDARGFSTTALLQRLKLEDERRIDAATVAIVRERLQRLLVEMGFEKARVLASLETHKRGTPRKRITLRLMPGPRVRVLELTFPGAARLPQERLREIVLSLVEERVSKSGLFDGIFYEQVEGTFGVGPVRQGLTAEGHPSNALPPRRVYLARAYRDAVEDIEKIYKTDGYTRVKISPPRAVPVPGTNNIRVEIPIDEGPRSTVGQVTFSGNALFSDEELTSEANLVRGSPYNPTMIEEGRRRVQRRYEAIGYIFARVEDEQTGCDKSCQEESERCRSKGGTAPVCALAQRVCRGRCLGAPVVDVAFRVREGERVYVSRLTLKGNVKTHDDVIYDVLKIGPGDIYSQKKIAESQQALFDLGLFSTVSIEPENSKVERRKALLVNLRERNPGAVEMGAGFSSYDGPRGFMNFSYANLFGRNLRALIYLKLNVQLFLYADPASRSARIAELSAWDLLERQLTASLQDPKILGLPIPLGWRLDLSHQRRSQLAYGLDKWFTALASLELKAFNKLNVQLQYEFEFTDLQTPQALNAFIKDVDRSPLLSGAEREQLKRTTPGRQVFGSIRPIVSLDLRDNPFNPRSGFIATVLGEYSASFFDGKVNYFKTQGTVTGHIPIGQKSQLALQYSMGGIFHLSGGSRTPAHRVFFLGGRASVRGYAEESIVAEGRPVTPSEVDALLRTGLPPTSTGGNFFFFGKAEYRFPLSGKLEGAIFYDVGNLWLNEESFDFARMPRMSTGFGIRVPTPVGPITFDVGFNLTRRFLRAEDPVTGLIRDVPYEGIFQIHFSVGVF